MYGIYAFNSVGGTMTDAVSAWNSDSGFYIGQTPPQTKPKRSIVKNVVSYGNVLGWSGTNMRYVTISKSKFYNNGAGMVPNTLSSEKYPPEEDNVITDNDIFWNNYNYYVGAPFKVGKAAADSTAYPVGVGILLFAGRHNRIDNNRIYGNWLAGAGMIQQIILKPKLPDVSELIGNQITEQPVRRSTATDLNGRDIAYDGTGTDNCISGNTGVTSTVGAADASGFAGVPVQRGEHVLADGQTQMVNWAVDSDHEKFLVQHPHAAQAGLSPLLHYSDYAGTKAP